MLRFGRLFRCLLLLCLIGIPGFSVRADDGCPNLAPATHTAFPSPPNSAKYSCYCVSGNEILKCSCDENSLDHFNNEIIFTPLADVLRRPYFRYFKVNLNRECPFWKNDDRCSVRDCSVETCSAEELPATFRNEVKSDFKEQVAEACAQEEELSSVDASLNAQQKAHISTWDSRMGENDFCVIDDEGSSDCSYIDLLKNPERYTGYAGASANRIWRTIYEENCFKPSKEQSVYSLAKSMQTEECEEKKAFFRVISGLHSSISVHLCMKHLLPLGQWGPNPQEFVRRFDDGFTDGEGSHRLSNLFFTYSIVLRALQKTLPNFKKEPFFTGVAEEDEEVRQSIDEISNFINAYPHHFDETRLFCGEPAEASRLKEEFRLHFRNISRIMDCVGCEKCRLWGKLQTQGIGTALKILFSDQADIDVLKLKRSEVVSLWNVFGRLSSSVKHIEEFRELLESNMVVLPQSYDSKEHPYFFPSQKPHNEL